MALAEAVTAGITRDEVLERVVAAAATLVPGPTVHLWLLDRATKQLRLTAEQASPPDHLVEPGLRVLEMGQGFVGTIAATGEALVVASVAKDDRLHDVAWVRERRLRSFAGVPVAHGDTLLGVLCLFTARRHLFTRRERALLRSYAAHAAAALENARLFAETRRRQETAERLTAISQTLTGSLDRRTVIQRVAAAVRDLLRCDGGAIGLTVPGGGLRLGARVGLGADAFRRVAAIRPGEGVAGWVLAHGEPFWTTDYAQDPRITPAFAEEVRAAGIVGVLAVPIRLQDEVVGVLCAFYGRAVAITGDDLALAADLAQVVAIAVANARLYREARKRETEARALVDVGRLINATLDLDHVLDLIVAKVLTIMRVRACGIFRLEEDGCLRYARGAGLSRTFVQSIVLPLGQGAAGRAVRERAPVWTGDLLADGAVALPPEARRLVEREGYRATLSVPILVKGAAFGCIATYWWDRHTPTPSEVETLTSLATLAAVAIENARLYGETRQHVDRLERLNQVNRGVSASLRLDDVLAEIARAASSFFEAPLVTLWLTDESQRTLTRRASHGLPALLAHVPLVLPFGEAGAGWVAEQRTPLIDASLRDDGRMAAWLPLIEQGMQTFSAFPIQLGDRLLGVLALGRTSAARLSTVDLTLLQTLLGQAAVALDNARLYEEVLRHEAEARQAYQDVKAAQEQLVRTEKLRALGEMASGVAHDFNNLLAAILGRTQLIKRQVHDPTLERWLSVIEQAALDGAQTVRQIQEFTRVRRDQPSQTVDVNQVVRDAVEITRTRWRDETQSRGLTVSVTLALGDIPPVDGHAAELREVLTNLILNAVDALTAGGTITLGTRAEPDAVLVSVADTGVGMPDTVRRRIFEPFFSTKGPKGTGLGLAMVYGIVSRHNGEITVESREGTGSTFTLRLPAARATAPLPTPPARLAARAALRVLVIDDEPQVREILGDMLQSQQHEVVVAEDGAAGLERFRAGGFDLVMTDLAMPRMSGWQVAQAVKTLQPEVPVVLVTGWGVEVPPEQLGQSGVDRVLSKPFGFDDVRETLASIMSLADATAEPGR